MAEGLVSIMYATINPAERSRLDEMVQRLRVAGCSVRGYEAEGVPRQVASFGKLSLPGSVQLEPGFVYIVEAPQGMTRRSFNMVVEAAVSPYVSSVDRCQVYVSRADLIEQPAQDPK